MKLCKAILSGFGNQLRQDGVTNSGVIGMHEADNGRNVEPSIDDGSALTMQQESQHGVMANGQILRFDIAEGSFFDDLTKQQLPTSLVKAARLKELDYFESKNVWK